PQAADDVRITGRLSDNGGGGSSGGNRRNIIHRPDTKHFGKFIMF
ncbi:10606_t:CDS:1, partial [Ambispora gerdemannii]